MGFMVRYVEVVGGELRRMSIARPPAGSTRSPRHWPVLARALGALFVRSYERGERVHLAMLSRLCGRYQPERVEALPTMPASRCWMSPRARRPRPLPTPTPTATRALTGVDLHVHRGERVALLGPNGAGKTTLVLHLNGILGAAHALAPGGHRHCLRYAGRRTPPEIRRRVGIVFQDPDDQLFMPTVRDDVAFGPGNLGLRGPNSTSGSVRRSRRWG
jgi:cobalt/nickel transport system permease protein